MPYTGWLYARPPLGHISPRFPPWQRSREWYGMRIGQGKERMGRRGRKGNNYHQQLTMLCVFVYMTCSLSSEAEWSLMRMESVYSETSRRIIHLQQQLDEHQFNWSSDDELEQQVIIGLTIRRKFIANWTCNTTVTVFATRESNMAWPCNISCDWSISLSAANQNASVMTQ